MENYADYRFYIEEYQQGSLSNDLFSKRIIEASREIDKHVNRNLTSSVLAGLSEEDLFKVKYTACKLCDYFETSKNIESISGSISIDGVSVSGMDAESLSTKESIIYDGLPHELIRYI